jgi:hypothetical protein
MYHLLQSYLKNLRFQMNLINLKYQQYLKKLSFRLYPMYPKLRMNQLLQMNLN